MIYHVILYYIIRYIVVSYYMYIVSSDTMSISFKTISNDTILYIDCMIVWDIWIFLYYEKSYFSGGNAHGKCDFSRGINLHISQTFMQHIAYYTKQEMIHVETPGSIHFSILVKQ